MTRHPFSFLSDMAPTDDNANLKRRGIWRERLLDYTGGDERARDMAVAGLRAAGRQAGIEFDFGAYINRQPIESQRLLLWAARQGKQEEYVSCLYCPCYCP